MPGGMPRLGVTPVGAGPLWGGSPTVYTYHIIRAAIPTRGDSFCADTNQGLSSLCHKVRPLCHILNISTC